MKLIQPDQPVILDDNIEDILELIYWEFDAERKEGSFSERDLFKNKMRLLIRNNPLVQPLPDPPEE